MEVKIEVLDYYKFVTNCSMCGKIINKDVERIRMVFGGNSNSRINLHFNPCFTTFQNAICKIGGKIFVRFPKRKKIN